MSAIDWSLTGINALLGFLVVAVLASFVLEGLRRIKRRNVSPDELTENGGGWISADRGSWQYTVIVLLALTVGLASLAVSGARHSTGNHLSPTDIFADLSGAGALLSGVAATLVVFLGSRGQRKKEEQKARDQVLNRVIEKADDMDPETIRALADLAAALNGDSGSSDHEISAQVMPPSAMYRRSPRAVRSNNGGDRGITNVGGGRGTGHSYHRREGYGELPPTEERMELPPAQH
jgi:hypothetical protein